MHLYRKVILIGVRSTDPKNIDEMSATELMGDIDDSMTSLIASFTKKPHTVVVVGDSGHSNPGMFARRQSIIHFLGGETTNSNTTTNRKVTSPQGNSQILPEPSTNTNLSMSTILNGASSAVSSSESSHLKGGRGTLLEHIIAMEHIAADRVIESAANTTNHRAKKKVTNSSSIHVQANHHYDDYTDVKREPSSSSINNDCKNKDVESSASIKKQSIERLKIIANEQKKKRNIDAISSDLLSEPDYDGYR